MGQSPRQFVSPSRAGKPDLAKAANIWPTDPLIHHLLVGTNQIPQPVDCEVDSHSLGQALGLAA